MAITFTGRVYDGLKRRADSRGGVFTFESIPGARVYVSDEEGNITPFKIQINTDIDGNYTLNVPMMSIKSPLTGKPMSVPRIDGKFITAYYPTLNLKSTFPITQSRVYNFDLSTKSGVQKIGEVIAKGDSVSEAEKQCIQNGGTYTRARKDASGNVIPGFCTLPNNTKVADPIVPTEEESWWKKLSTGAKVGIIGGGLLVAGLIVFGIAKLSTSKTE